MEPWNADFAPPRPPHIIGVELRSGHVLHLGNADSLVWGQTGLIQIAAAMRAGGGAGVVVLVHVASGQVRERITIASIGHRDD